MVTGVHGLDGKAVSSAWDTGVTDLTLSGLDRKHLGMAPSCIFEAGTRVLLVAEGTKRMLYTKNRIPKHICRFQIEHNKRA